MLAGILDLPPVYMGFRVNSCEVSYYTEETCKDILKI